MIAPALPLGFWGYALALVTFGVLAFLLGAGARGNPNGRWLILASVINALWAVEMAADAYFGLPAIAVYWAEFLRASAWLLFLHGVGRPAIGAIVPRILVIGIGTIALLGVLISFGVRPDVFRIGSLLSVTGMLLALLVLIVLEQIYRSAANQTRWSLRFLVIGLGSVYAFDLSMYAEANMLRMLDANVWQARGFVNAVLLPLILITARRNPEWQLDVFVSRQITFYTGAILGVGIYVLMMAFGGYLAVRFGGRWGVVLQTIFLVVAGATLLTLVFSTNINRRARVFLHKHFYRNKYDYRIEWLRFVKTLSVADSEGLGPTVVRAVAQIFSCPGGLLFISNGDGRSLVPHAAWPEPLESIRGAEQLNGADALFKYLHSSRWVIDLREYSRRPDRYDNVPIPQWLTRDANARLIAPLLLGDRIVGILALQEPPLPFVLSYEDRDLLKTVCQHIATHVAQYLADQRLAESHQFQAHGKLAAFMMHDLKNSVAQLQLVVENSKRHKHDPQFLDDAFSTTGSVVERINKLILQLRDRGETSQLVVDLGPLLRTVVSQLRDERLTPRLERCDSDCLVLCDPTRLAAAIEHAIRNALDATPVTGQVLVRLLGGSDNVRIEVTDTGSGMTAQFVRDRLFRPFDSTKGAKGMGIGAYQTREYAREIRGDVEVLTAPGQGTTFCFILPRAALTQ